MVDLEIWKWGIGSSKVYTTNQGLIENLRGQKDTVEHCSYFNPKGRDFIVSKPVTNLVRKYKKQGYNVRVI